MGEHGVRDMLSWHGTLPPPFGKLALGFVCGSSEGTIVNDTVITSTVSDSLG